MTNTINNRQDSKKTKKMLHDEPSQARYVQDLQRKYKEECLILTRENTRLQKQLHHELEQANHKKLQKDKQDKLHQKHIDELQTEIQSLRVKLLENNKHKDDDQNEEQLATLKDYKQLLLHNQKLKADVQENCQMIDNLVGQRDTLQRQNRVLQNEINKVRMEMGELSNLLTEINQQRDKIAHQSNKYSEQFEDLQQENQLLKDSLKEVQEKLIDAKRRKKQNQKKISELQQKWMNFQQKQTARYSSQLSTIKHQKQQTQQKNIQLTTKIEFLQISITQKDQIIKNITNEAKQSANNHLEKEHSLQQELTALEDRLRKSRNEMEELVNKLKQQQDVWQKRLEEEISIYRKKIIEQVYLLLKGKDQQKCERTLQNEIDGLRNCKSHGKFLDHQRTSNENMMLNRQEVSQSNLLFDRIKLQNQLAQLEHELSVCKKQAQTLHIQLKSAKQSLEDKKIEYDSKCAQVTELKSKYAKIEKQKHFQVMQMRTQLAQLRSKQTEYLQMLRDKAEFEEATQLKMTFLDKKIKELIDTIERKESIIEKTKSSKCELEDKMKMYEDNIRRLMDEAEGCKRAKGDVVRKDELMRDYKTRMEKAKLEAEQYKGEVQTLKKQKNRLEKLLQAKQSYIYSLKQKHEKQRMEVDNERVEGKQTKMKQLKGSYEQKLKKLKMEIESYYAILCEIKEVIIAKVEELVAKSLPKKKKVQDYEGAKLLGLKASEMEQFINPGICIDKSIIANLQKLWIGNNYTEFTKCFIDYICSKGDCTR